MTQMAFLILRASDEGLQAQVFGGQTRVSSVGTPRMNGPNGRRSTLEETVDGVADAILTAWDGAGSFVRAIQQGLARSEDVATLFRSSFTPAQIDAMSDDRKIKWCQCERVAWMLENGYLPGTDLAQLE